LKSDPNVQHLLKDFVVPPIKNNSFKDTTEDKTDKDSVLQQSIK
jgi:hypothetical protein